MADEEIINEDVNEEALPESQPEEPVVDEVEAPDEPEEVEEPTEPEETEEPVAPEPPAPSRREQLRIQQLLKKYGPPPERRQQPSQQNQPGIDYRQMIDADDAVYRNLEQASASYGQQQYNAGLREAQAIEFRTNIKLDYPLVKDRLEKLDPVDVNALNEEYLHFVGYDQNSGYVQNPNIGYAEYVEARIEQAERLASRISARTTKNIAKQAAQTGLRPDGSQSKRLNLNQAPDKMSDEELDAVIARSLPRK